MKELKKIKITTSNPSETNYVEATDFYVHDGVLYLMKNDEKMGGFGFPLNFIVVEQEDKTIKKKERSLCRSIKFDLADTINEFVDDLIIYEDALIGTPRFCCKTNFVNKEKLLINLNKVLQGTYELNGPSLNNVLTTEEIINFTNKLHEIVMIKENGKTDIRYNRELNLLDELAEEILHRLFTLKDHIRYYVTMFLKENHKTPPTKEKLVEYCKTYGNLDLDRARISDIEKQNLNKRINEYIYTPQTPETVRNLINEITEALSYD